MEINIEQLSLESGVTIKGVFQKGDKITFLDLSKEDEAKVREALKTHVPNPIIKVDKLDLIINELNTIKAKVGL